MVGPLFSYTAALICRHKNPIAVILIILLIYPCQNVNVLPTSIREIEQGIFVSPNPAKDNMFVTFSNENNVWKKFEILDITGRVILSNVINNSRLEIDLKGIVDGVYVITLLSPNEPSHSVKFVIQGNN